jgi:membrane associated rhomboid family serine protease
MFNVPSVVLAVIGLLIAVHACLWWLGTNGQVWANYALSFIPARLGGGDPIPAPPGAAVWSFVTYALLHADVYHLGSNCLWLLIFSTPVARRMGTLRYLALLLLTAAAGAAAMLPQFWGEFMTLVGASGSVSGVMAAAIPIMFAPGFKMGRGASTTNLTHLNVLTPSQLIKNTRALTFAALFFFMTFITGAAMALGTTAFLEERSIAWQAHLGGFLAGIVLFYLLDRRKM